MIKINQKYSIFVFVSKKLLIIISICLLLALLFPLMDFSKVKFQFHNSKSSNLISNQNFGSLVSNPKFYGIDKNNKYEIIAKKASEKIKGQIFLEKPFAKIAFNNDFELTIISDSGIWKQLTKILEINNDVNMIYNSDYQASTISVIFNLGQSLITGSNPIIISNNLGNLSAGGFKADIKDKKIYFSAPIVMTIKEYN